MSLLKQLRDYELRMRAEGQKPAEGEETAEGGMPFMYALQPVRWEVRLNGDGSVRDVQPLSSGKTKGVDWGKPIPAPNLVRSGSGANPRLIMDNAEYVLGIQKEEGSKGTARAEKYHLAYKMLIRQCVEATGESDIKAILNFLNKHDPADFQREHLPQDFLAAANVTFSVDGRNPLELLSVQDFWGNRFSRGDLEAECLITGQFGTVISTEPVKIKGVVGGQPAGMNLISANADAFESYGLKQSQIAPVKFEVAEQYASGLNRLLSDPNTRMRMGGMTYAFWTGDGAVPIIGPLLETESPKLGFGKKRERRVRPEEVRETLWSIFTDKQPTLKRGAAFFAVGMTPSGGRIAVRTHLTSTVQDAVDHIADFFAAQRLAPINPEGSKYPDAETYDIRTLVSGLYRDMSKENAAPDVDTLVQHALTGQALPRSFLPKLAARNRAEKRVTRPRAVLTKMVLLSRDWKDLNMDKETLDALNPDQKEPAYHLGRLLAVLDDIQSSVMRANTTLVDRFYGSMSTTPYAVVGRLMHGSQAHLQKLRKEKPGVYKMKQDELEAVMSRLADIPAKPLTTPQQALFALGYYHQRAHISEGIREGKAAKEAKAEAEKNATQPTLLSTEGESNV